MALPTDPQNYIVIGEAQPPVVNFVPIRATDPYGCMVINFYNGSEPIVREIWIEDLDNDQDLWDMVEWGIGWSEGSGGLPDDVMLEILIRTHYHSGDRRFNFIYYDFDTSGNLIYTSAEHMATIPDRYADYYTSWKLNTTTDDMGNFDVTGTVGGWYKLSDTMNVKTANFQNSTQPFVKYTWDTEPQNNTVPYTLNQFAVLYNDVDPDVEEDYSYGELSGPGGGTGGSFDNSSDAVDFASLPTGGAAASGLITMFAPTAAQLQAFGQFLWTTLFDAGFDSLLTSLKKWVNDPVESVIQLAAFPVTPPAGSAQIVKFCGIASDLVGAGVSMNKCTSQFMDFDFGQLATPAYWKQTLDYSPYTQVSIYLPYIGICPLKSDDVIDATLHLKYHIDLLTGGFSAELKCSKNINGTPLSSVLYNWSGNMATQIPITSANFSQVFGSMMTAVAAIGVGAITGGMGAAAAGAGAEATGAIAGGALSGAGHGLAANIGNVINSKPHVTKSGRLDGTVGALSQFTPYLIIERPVQSLSAKFQEEQGYPSNIVQRLGDLSGMTVCEAPIMSGFSGATEEEKAAIRAMLCEGVIL